MRIDGTEIDDTFAEAFGMRYTRLILTAHDAYWLRAAVAEFTGYATSVIACDVEAGCESWLAPDGTPDGRIGASVLVFGFASASLAAAVTARAGQCVMTCPSTALYDGLEPALALETFPLGKHLRYFGDGFQKSKVLGDQRFWRIPVMDGEFVCGELGSVAKGIAGGNFILQCRQLPEALAAARRAVEAIGLVPGTMTPFPGGAVRSGSKVGSRYPTLKASTAEAYCPVLRDRVESRLHPEANAAIEIVIDGADKDAVGRAMVAGIRAACGPETLAISAGNYGGKLGPHHFHLRKLL